jgi:aminoglycoside N3'-acetyltransferase
MAKYEIGSLDELDKVKELLREYPEWVRTFKPKDFGMAVDENADDLTEEEKKLKQMGIDPRD